MLEKQWEQFKVDVCADNLTPVEIDHVRRLFLSGGFAAYIVIAQAMTDPTGQALRICMERIKSEMDDFVSQIIRTSAERN